MVTFLYVQFSISLHLVTMMCLYSGLNKPMFGHHKQLEMFQRQTEQTGKTKTNQDKSTSLRYNQLTKVSACFSRASNSDRNCLHQIQFSIWSKTQYSKFKWWQNGKNCDQWCFFLLLSVKSSSCFTAHIMFAPHLRSWDGSCLIDSWCE